ncbi:hypothetical protein ANO11243_088270 [Dothideomycetidae sp. 11243]|nr:hypothetical protein ANO11243_088270 [fungal sp. No.11243]
MSCSCPQSPACPQVQSALCAASKGHKTLSRLHGCTVAPASAGTNRVGGEAERKADWEERAKVWIGFESSFTVIVPPSQVPSNISAWCGFSYPLYLSNVSAACCPTGLQVVDNCTQYCAVPNVNDMGFMNCLEGVMPGVDFVVGCANRSSYSNSGGRVGGGSRGGVWAVLVTGMVVFGLLV